MSQTISSETLRELYNLLTAAKKEAENSARITNTMLEKLKKHETLDPTDFVKLPSSTNRTYEKVKMAFIELSKIPPFDTEGCVLVCGAGFNLSRFSGASESLTALAKALHASDKKLVAPTPSPADEDLYA